MLFIEYHTDWQMPSNTRGRKQHHVLQACRFHHMIQLNNRNVENVVRRGYGVVWGDQYNSVSEDLAMNNNTAKPGNF